MTNTKNPGTCRLPVVSALICALVAVMLTGLLVTVPMAAAASTVPSARQHSLTTHSAPLRHACAPAHGRVATCFAEFRSAGRRPFASAAAKPQLTPADIASAYRLPSSTSQLTVGIVDAFDNPRAEQDLATYRARFHLPACTTANGCLRKVNQDGKTNPLPAGDPDWGVEISLDLDAVSAACPSCHILLVEASDPRTARSAPV